MGIYRRHTFDYNGSYCWFSANISGYGEAMKTLKQQVAVMLAADEGKTIIFKDFDSLVSHGPINKDEPFNWHDFDYEIVEEPWEGWVNLYPNSNTALGTYSTETLAKNTCSPSGRTIKVREVIE